MHIHGILCPSLSFPLSHLCHVRAEEGGVFWHKWEGERGELSVVTLKVRAKLRGTELSTGEHSLRESNVFSADYTG